MVSICPFSARKSFKPEKAQIELACAGAPVLLSEPEPMTPGVPGGPFTSPAKAAPALAPTTATPQSAVAKKDFVRMSLPFLGFVARAHTPCRLAKN
jgi:hypothetical protein